RNRPVVADAGQSTPIPPLLAHPPPTTRETPGQVAGHDSPAKSAPPARASHGRVIPDAPPSSLADAVPITWRKVPSELGSSDGRCKCTRHASGRGTMNATPIYAEL